MRKIIIAICLLLVGVLCLSYITRISNSIFNIFSSGDTSSDINNSPNNNSSDNSGGSEENGSSNETDTTLPEYYFSPVSETLNFNYFIDTSNYYKNGNYYYYTVKYDGESRYVKSDEILSGSNWIIDAYATLYEVSDIKCEETDEISMIIDLDNFPDNETYYFFENWDISWNWNTEFLYGTLQIYEDQYCYYGWCSTFVGGNGSAFFIKELYDSSFASTQYLRIDGSIYSITFTPTSETENPSDAWSNIYEFNSDA